MPLINIWSRRKANQTSTSSDPLQYDQIPKNVRIQLVHILSEIRTESSRISDSLIDSVVSTLRKEFGVFQLIEGYHQDSIEELGNWIINEPNIDRILDALEVTIVTASGWRGDWSSYSSEKLKSQITEINDRFLEARVGYQMVSGQFIKLSDEYNHSQVVVPTLQLIHEKGYESTATEFLSAHSAFRNKDYEKTLVECAKSLESLLKVIADRRSWGLSSNATLNQLFQKAFDTGFLPQYLSDSFAGLRSVLNSVGTVRNKDSAHGAGTQSRKVSQSLARFQLNQTAAVIRFLIDSYNS